MTLQELLIEVGKELTPELLVKLGQQAPELARGDLATVQQKLADFLKVEAHFTEAELVAQKEKIAQLAEALLDSETTSDSNSNGGIPTASNGSVPQIQSSLLSKLGPNEPNPNAYEIPETFYGARIAYPNLAGKKKQADELAHGKRNGIIPLEIPAEPNEEVQRILYEQYAGSLIKWVVTTEGDMFVIPYRDANRMEFAHTIAAQGQDVIAAGQAKISPEGQVESWDGRSGHFRPEEKFSVETAHAIFHFAGLLTKANN